MDVSLEGSGQIVEMMKQFGAMKVTSRVNGVSTEPISDDMFKVPEDYKIVK
jgi:hypothetical protein